jgi:hypothetical protein
MTRLTKYGTIIQEGFYPSISGDEPFRLRQKLVNKGFKDLYYTAPYHWAMFNARLNTIVTYTEGDYNTMKSSTKDVFRLELRDTAKWVKGEKMHLDEDVTDYFKGIKRRG